MGGESKTSQTQQSTTTPWETAQPALTGILGQVNQGLGNTNLTGAEGGALSTLAANGQNTATQFAPAVQGYASNLLSGGGATAQAPMIDQSYQDYVRRLTPTANGSMIGQNPALQAQLDTIRSDVTNQVNGQFAGAGRDFSGANFQTLGRGIAQGEAPVIAQQYNTDTANQRSAADALYSGSNTTGGLLTGLTQQGLANQGQGVAAVGQANDVANTGANAVLQAEAARRGIPVQALGLLAQIGIPIAGLGSQSTGQSQGTNQMSGAQQFGLIGQGLGGMSSGLFGGNNGGGLIPGIAKLFG